MNKRTIENFIKAGAFDSLGATRRQQMMVYVQVLDQVNAEKKKSMTGQMSLFDFVGEEEKQDFDVKYPDVGEMTKKHCWLLKRKFLAFIFSGHPLEEFEAQWRKSVTAVTTDFETDDELGHLKSK